MGAGDAFYVTTGAADAEVAHDEATSDVEYVRFVGEGGTAKEAAFEIGNVDAQSLRFRRKTADFVVDTGLEGVELTLEDSLIAQGGVISVETGELELNTTSLESRVHVILKPGQV